MTWATGARRDGRRSSSPPGLSRGGPGGGRVEGPTRWRLSSLHLDDTRGSSPASRGEAKGPVLGRGRGWDAGGLALTGGGRTSRSRFHCNSEARAANPRLLCYMKAYPVC